MGSQRRYRAFLSYSHQGEATARKLHRALESYRVPQHLRASSGTTISPIFRDKAELTASSSLSESIKTALRDSDVLIVMASPAAKQSRWVNDEIRFFREMHGSENILCALIEGTAETSFPEALTETGKEPMAADLSRRNFRIGLTQLSASLLCVGLDELMQRDLKKARQRVTAITASACVAMLVMGSLTWARHVGAATRRTKTAGCGRAD